MMKNFRSVKASLIMGILLLSLFVAAAAPISAANGGIFGFSQAVTLNWNTANQTMIIDPFGGTKSYDLKLTYSVSKGGSFGGLYYAIFLAGRQANIKLTKADGPNWATITIPSQTYQMKLPQNVDETPTPLIVSIQMSVDETAPAGSPAQIGIEVTVDPIGPVPKFDNVAQLDITPSYLGKLSSVAGQNSVQIGPMDQASIPIQVTNQGNGQTIAQFKIISDIPNGWSVLVTDQVTLNPKETGTVYLTAIPPKGFGYHDDQATFVIEYTPIFSNNPSYSGEPQTLTIAIQSRGVSIIGIEVILPIIILIVVVLFLIYLFIKRIRGK